MRYLHSLAATRPLIWQVLIPLIGAAALIFADANTLFAMATGKGVFAWDVNHTGSIDASVLNNVNVDGFTIEFLWDAVEPQEGVYDWTAIDTQIAQAADAGKKVTLEIKPGAMTPSWVYSDGAQAFDFIWDKRWGLPACSVQTLPVPWDPIYLAKWTAFISAFGARYDNDPTVVQIKITGVNSETAETKLPISQNAAISVNGSTCTSYDDIADWQAVGYTRTKVETAWSQIAAAFQQAFPNQELAGVLIPGGFPPLDNNGQLITGTDDRQLSEDLIANGMTQLGAQYTVQNDGLSATWIWKKETANQSLMDTGYQTISVLSSQLPTAINLALSNNATMLEIYEADILTPSLTSSIAKAHNTLGSTSSPTPTATATPTPSPTASATPAPTPTATPTATPTPTMSPTPTPTASPTPSGSPTPTPSPSPSPTPHKHKLRYSPRTLRFGHQAMGQPSSARFITVTNPRSGTVAANFVGAVTSNSQFSVDWASTTCGATLAVGEKCKIAVQFVPAGTGHQNGSVSISNSFVDNPENVASTGITTIGRGK